MTLPNLPAQSSDKLSIDPNPRATNVFSEGSLTFSGFAATTGGYYASARIDLSSGDKGTANVPVIDFLHYVDYGSGVFQYRQGPYIILDPSTGVVSNQLSMIITNQLVTGTTYEVFATVTYFTSSISSGVKDSAYWTQYGYYKIYTNSWTNVA